MDVVSLNRKTACCSQQRVWLNRCSNGLAVCLWKIEVWPEAVTKRAKNSKVPGSHFYRWLRVKITSVECKAPKHKLLPFLIPPSTSPLRLVPRHSKRERVHELPQEQAPWALGGFWGRAGQPELPVLFLKELRKSDDDGAAPAGREPWEDVWWQTTPLALTKSCSEGCPYSRRWERSVIPNLTASYTFFFPSVSHLVNFRALYEKTKYKYLGTETMSERKSSMVRAKSALAFVSVTTDAFLWAVLWQENAMKGAVFITLYFGVQCSTLQNTCFVSGFSILIYSNAIKPTTLMLHRSPSASRMDRHLLNPEDQPDHFKTRPNC